MRASTSTIVKFKKTTKLKKTQKEDWICNFLYCNIQQVKVYLIYTIHTIYVDIDCLL